MHVLAVVGVVEMEEGATTGVPEETMVVVEDNMEVEVLN